MNVQNFKTRMQIEMEMLMEAWKNGEVEWNMGNQFDESVLESALKNFDNEEAMSDEKWAWWANMDKPSVMSLAHNLASWKAPELDSGWVD